MKTSFMQANSSFARTPEPTSIAKILEEANIEFPKRVQKLQHAWSTSHELQFVDTSTPDMLLEAMLPTSNIALLVGDPGMGKSTLARKLCEAIVEGEDQFLARKLHCRHRSAIYVSCEDNIDSIARAKQASDRLAGASIDQSGHDRLRYLWGQDLTLKEVIEEVTAAIEVAPVDIIVFDCVGNLMEGDQNRNSDVQRFFKQFAGLATKTLCLFLHHFRKQTGESCYTRMEVQGAGAFVHRARSVLAFAGQEESITRYLWITKENFGIDTLKRSALEIQYETTFRTISTTGELVPMDEVRRILSGKQANDLRDLFQTDEIKLQTHEIVKRAWDTFTMPRRTAMDRLAAMSKTGTLTKIAHGVYSLRPEPPSQSKHPGADEPNASKEGNV